MQPSDNSNVTIPSARTVVVSAMVKNVLSSSLSGCILKPFFRAKFLSITERYAPVSKTHSKGPKLFTVTFIVLQLFKVFLAGFANSLLLFENLLNLK